ncbi:MAG: carboxynorspermidine decarboxylase [Alistipes sp.]|nr:carboxynorspermidine decarboxylase [Alistipes sp.]
MSRETATACRIPSPCYVLDESLLRRNLSVIKDVADRSGAEIIVALKANATWSVFPVMREYVNGATASSLAEARLVWEEFGTPTHTYAPVYTDSEIEEILRYSSHITFNSVAQFERFGPMAILRGISCGLRINPGWSPVETCLYNPCSPGSRLGIPHEQLADLPDGVEGLHFHNLCESGAEELVKTLESVERLFGHLLPKVKWINFGGGHLMTREGYDRELLIATVRAFRERYPGLRVILEPGSAFTWQTGWLEATVEDIVHSGGVSTLMVNVSFACHMPDCLEMPYTPAVRGAHDPAGDELRWRIGGNSCLAGDYMGDWAFDREPRVGDRIVFEDMIHYTMVKTTMFNGVAHPSIAILRQDGTLDVVRRFGYEDYRDRMS